MRYTLEDDITLPPSTGGGSARSGSKYPWLKMRVGQSFLVPGAHIGMMVSSAAYAKRRGWGTFTCRTVEGGVRVWRTA